MRSFIRFNVVFTVLAISLLVPLTSAAGDVINLEWQKTETGAMTFAFDGTVEGDLDGTLTSFLLSARFAGPIVQVLEFIWIIDTGDVETSFTACTTGIINTNTGGVVLNGEVCEGAFLGRKFHDQGQLVGVTAAGQTMFEGTIRLMPNK